MVYAGVYVVIYERVGMMKLNTVKQSSLIVIVKPGIVCLYLQLPLYLVL